MAATPDNPWLQIPASDYDGHMSDPGVGQRSFLSRMMAHALDTYDSERVALLGCATGNGLEHVDPERTRILTAVDINAAYIKILENRFSKRLKCLSCINSDVKDLELESDFYSLIFAGLIFEYINPEIVLEKINQWLKPGGILFVILQRPAANNETVSPSKYKSLQLLKSLMKLVSPEDFKRMAKKNGLHPASEKSIMLESKKSFYTAAFLKRA